MKYSDCLAEWLAELGYTHCFYVAGGNIMHLLESLSHKLDCRAVINEVAAGIATEYFNETSPEGKALALVTAGPGLTNIVTAMAGAYLESRELLVIGGQVKTADLARGALRQRGIQEIDGVSIVKSVSVLAELIEEPLSFREFARRVLRSRHDRKGPVFLEFPLDVQGKTVDFPNEVLDDLDGSKALVSDQDFAVILNRLDQAERPLLLVGGGVSRESVNQALDGLARLGIPIVTTWNATDRIDFEHPLYMGRPNTWGQRSANLVMQQADLLLALGTRLGMQQTGFNWRGFLPNGSVVQVDIDEAELEKGHPEIDLGICADANNVLSRLSDSTLKADYSDWVAYARSVRLAIPLVEPVNQTRSEYISPYCFVDTLSNLCRKDDVVIPCSSGGAFTVMMQIFRQKKGQMIVTNKGLASMGYGLSGAIGAAFANPSKRVILVEGDGGFAQNLQEIGTAAINRLNLKIFIFDDSGYASIRMTQRNYFGGRYVGCDTETGLGLPDWEKLFSSWDVPVTRVGAGYETNSQFRGLFELDGTAAFIVSIDPAQTYFPKITSRITDKGEMESNPLHLMTPNLPEDIYAAVSKYLGQ